jgi:predicted metal-binding membrane protein
MHSPGKVSLIILWSVLLTVAALAWIPTTQQAVMIPQGPGTMGLGFAAFLALWTLMMVAMMFPSVAPVVSMYLLAIRRRATGMRLFVRTGSFLTGYLIAWAAFGIPAFGVAWLGGQLASTAPRIATWVGAALLLIAGVYQLTPLKDRCLSHCRSALGWLFHFGNYSGPLRDIRSGLYHGGCHHLEKAGVPWQISLSDQLLGTAVDTGV